MKKLLTLLLALLLVCGSIPAMGEPLAALQETEDLLPPPEVVRMLDIARGEYALHGGKRLNRSNTYTLWYYGDKTAIGWCAAFTSWCAAQAEMPLLKEAQVLALIDGDDKKLKGHPPITEIPDVFMMNEVNVIRCRNSYMKTDRLMDIPEPGYQIFYGRIGGAPTLHTAFVETVRLIEEGVYEITTLEGNVGSRVKRYCMRYTVSPRRRHYNMAVVPKDQRIVEDVQYKLHSDDWMITGFGKTW